MSTAASTLVRVETVQSGVIGGPEIDTCRSELANSIQYRGGWWWLDASRTSTSSRVQEIGMASRRAAYNTVMYQKHGKQCGATATFQVTCVIIVHHPTTRPSGIGMETPRGSAGNKWRFIGICMNLMSHSLVFMLSTSTLPRYQQPSSCTVIPLPSRSLGL